LDPQIGPKNKWFTTQNANADDHLGWIHVIFPKPLLLNGIGITSANDFRDRDPKNFRVYGKID